MCYFCILGHKEEAETWLTVELKAFGRNWWVRKTISDGAWNPKAHFQIIQVSYSAEPRMRLE